MKATIPILLACLIAGGIAVPATSTDSPASDELDRLVGDSICAGHIAGMGKDPGQDTSGRFHGERTLDGHWVMVQYEQDRSAARPKPFKVTMYLGFDPAARRYRLVMVGNGDGVYSVGSSPGWKGNTLTFDEVETAHGAPHRTREAFTAAGSGLAGYTGWFRDTQGNWIKFDEETCHKT